MTPTQLKQSREKLGLSIAQAAAVLETDPTTVKRMERDDGQASHRAAPARVVRLYQAMLYGWRPKDFPKVLRGKNAPTVETLEDLI